MKKRRMLLFLSILILLLFVLSFRYMGKLLISTSPPEKSDLVFILLGPVPERALLAADLYHEGYAPRILMANEFQAGVDAKMAEKLHIDQTAQVFRKALLSVAVPDSVIQILPDIASSTKDEAIILTNYLEQHADIKRVLVVTSSFHGLRTKKLMYKSIKRLNHEVIICVPENKYSVFNADAWWSNRYSSVMVALEYLKLLNYYLNDQFNL